MWNIAATLWLYCSLNVDFDKNKSVLTARLLKSLLMVVNQQPTYRHYVQNLKIKMPPTEGDSSRRRLQPGVLETLARLVPLLSMLNSFICVSSLAASYAPIFSNAIPDGKFPRQCRNYCLRRFTITQSCPVDLLFSRAGVLTKNADTSNTPNLSELVIDFRPRRHVTADLLADLTFSQKQLLLKQQNLKPLTIKFTYEDARMYFDQIRIDRQEQLPSIERLSLECYFLIRDSSGIQFDIKTQSLWSLTLVACTQWDLLLGIPNMKLSQLIIRAPR